MNKFPHDGAYKTFFGYADMMKSLLGSFVPKDFVRELDFNTLERCNNSYSSKGFLQKFNDIVWRLRWKHEWCYICILLEFQSAPDYWMGLRVTTYSSLFWSELVRQNAVRQGEKLPPVFPIVIYNGDRLWTAACNIFELVHQSHEDLKNFQPFQQYYLLDVKRLPKNVLESASGEAAWIFRAEQASSGKAVYDIAREIFHDEPESQNSTLFGAIFNWLELKIRKMDPFLWRKLKKNNSGSELMLLEALKKYERELDLYREELQAESRKRLLHEGKTAGLEEGRAEGIKLGRAEGIELGRAEGIELGRAEGINLGRAEGIDLGRAEGIDLGRVVGIETGSMETASEILQCGLEARFGRIPPQMQMKLSTIKNADDLKKLANYLYSARDLNQFEEFLNSLAGGV